MEYVGIEYILDRFNRDYDFLEDAVNDSNIVEWIGDALMKMPENKILKHKITDGSNTSPVISISNYKGKLPCDYIAVVNVRDVDDHCVYDYATDLFLKHKEPHESTRRQYTISNDYIYVNVEECELEIAYLSIALDENNKPLIPNVEEVIDYICKFIAKIASRKLAIRGVLSNSWYKTFSGEYEMAKNKARSALQAVSIDEADNISNMWLSLTRSRHHRKTSFKNLGVYSR